MNAESESLRTEYGKLLILLDSFDDQKKSVTRFLTKVGIFADMEITKDDRYILEQLIEKVTIQEIETKIKVLVHFVVYWLDFSCCTLITSATIRRQSRNIY